jgi:hypothetical protein
MHVPLPEALLLFALHDAKGTVHSVAFLAIDHALRAAVLCELKLRGHVQTRLPSEIRHHPRPRSRRPPRPVRSRPGRCASRRSCPTCASG